MALKKIYKITFPTLETLNYFKDLNIIDEHKLEILYDPIIHTRNLGKIKNENLISNYGDFYISNIGRFSKQKNFFFLIKCFVKKSKKDQKYQISYLR